MSWDWFVFSVNWHCQRHQGSAVTYTGRCGILNMFFLCWVSTNIHSWHPLAWLVIDSLTSAGQWGKMHIGLRLCAGHCCHPLFDTVAAEWECVEENDPSHPAAFRPYSTVRMDLILTVLADGILHHHRPRCAFMPPPQPSAHPSPPFSPSPHPTSSTRSGSGREWGSAPRPSHLRYRFIYAFLTHMKSACPAVRGRLLWFNIRFFLLGFCIVSENCWNFAWQQPAVSLTLAYLCQYAWHHFKVT